MSHNTCPTFDRILRLFVLLVMAGIFGPASAAAQESDNQRRYVQLTIVGKLSPDQRSITAAGKAQNAAAKFEIVLPSDSRLSRDAGELAGKTIVARGALVQCTENGQRDTPKCDRRRSPSGLFFVPVSFKEFRKKDGSATDKDHLVSVVCRGLVHSDVVALGGETTGYEIELTSDGRETWELQLADRDAEKARKLNGRSVLVSGTVSVKKGVAISERWIVTVRNLLPK